MTPAAYEALSRLRADDPVDADRAATDLLRANGVPTETWPADDTSVCDVLTDLGYRVTGDDLLAIIERGLVVPATGEDGREWSATDCVRAVGILERRRAWLPGSRHAPKQHPAEQLLGLARAEGQMAALARPHGCDAREDVADLVAILAAEDDREVRRKVACCLAAVLEAEHDIVVF